MAITEGQHPQREVRASAAELIADDGAHDLTMAVITIGGEYGDLDAYNLISDAIKDGLHEWADKFRRGVTS